MRWVLLAGLAVAVGGGAVLFTAEVPADPPGSSQARTHATAPGAGTDLAPPSAGGAGGSTTEPSGATSESGKGGESATSSGPSEATSGSDETGSDPLGGDLLPEPKDEEASVYAPGESERTSTLPRLPPINGTILDPTWDGQPFEDPSAILN